MHRLVVCCLFLFVHSSYQNSPPSGAVQLDDVSFHKLTKKFDASLVKFDVAYPYGDKHDAFVAIARDSKDVDELLVAEVGVKDYGEKDNEELARKYGASKDNFPVVKLFLKDKSDPITFDESKGFTTDELRRFVREHTGLYLSMPGCIRVLDTLSQKFMQADKEEKKKLLTEAEATVKKLDSKDAPSGKVYKTIMEKILEKGDEFSKTELERVKKLLAGKILKEKKDQMNIRLNILQAFQANNLQKKSKQEL